MGFVHGTPRVRDLFVGVENVVAEKSASDASLIHAGPTAYPRPWRKFILRRRR
jgi:hypothetical protein